DSRKVFHQHFSAALGPAYQLSPQPAQGLWQQYPPQGMGLDKSFPLCALELPSHVDVCREHANASITDIVECATPEGRHDTGHGEELSIDALGALDQAYNG